MHHVYAVLVYAAILSLLFDWSCRSRSAPRVEHQVFPSTSFSVQRQHPNGQPPNMFAELNEEAKASDLSGLRKYSRTLIGYLAGTETGKVNAGLIVDRLAQAELESRQGKRKTISEQAVADAFNALMQRTGAPGLKANLTDIEKSRLAFAEQMPAVIPPDKSRCCTPGEAIWIEVMLLQNLGAHYPPGSLPHVGNYVPPASASLQNFLARHSTRENTDLLIAFEKDLSI